MNKKISMKTKKYVFCSTKCVLLAFFLFWGLLGCSNDIIGYYNKDGNDVDIAASVSGNQDFLINGVNFNVDISTSDTLKVKTPGAIKFSFDEDVVGFKKDDVKLPDNVKIDSFSAVEVDDGKYIYTLRITPNSEGVGLMTVEIPTGSFKGASGLPNLYVSTNFIVIDEKSPSLKISSTDSPLEVGKESVITFSFDEDVVDFKRKDIYFSSKGVSGEDITVSKFDNDNFKKYTLAVTPKRIGDLIVEIPSDSVKDLSGNSNLYTSAKFSIRDNIPPFISNAIIGNVNGKFLVTEFLVKGELYSLSFLFSEDVTNFTSDDIHFSSDGSIVEVDKGNFIVNSLRSYSLEITPEITLEKERASRGHLTIRIPDYSFEDLAGNGNTVEHTTKILVSRTAEDPTYNTISVLPKGGEFTSPQVNSLRVTIGNRIDESDLRKIVTYHPTGPQPGVVEVARELVGWRKDNGGDIKKYTDRLPKYDFDNPPDGHLTLVPVWRNSCGIEEKFHPTSKADLKKYVDEALKFTHAPDLNGIDTSAVTDMSELFRGQKEVEPYLGCWNTSKVTSMAYMFADTDKFIDESIGKWDVSSVTNMAYMFSISSLDPYYFTEEAGYHPFFFNGYIGDWNVSSVKDMTGMFINAYTFNQPIGKWDLSSLEKMDDMFHGAYQFNQNINNWDVSKVRSMRNVFRKASYFNQPLNNWNVSKVTNMAYMFDQAYYFNQPLNRWDVSSVKNMRGMFAQKEGSARSADQREYVAKLRSACYGDSQEVKDMMSQFYFTGCNPDGSVSMSSSLEVSCFAGVVGVDHQWFYQSTFNQDINRWDVSSVKDMSEMFAHNGDYNQPLERWNVSSVENMDKMFIGARYFNQDISSWSVGQVKSFDRAFEGSAIASQVQNLPRLSRP